MEFGNIGEDQDYSCIWNLQLNAYRTYSQQLSSMKIIVL